MSRIKNKKPDKFFAKEYDDGIIVAFKNIGDNNSFFADQIHQVVLDNLGVEYFSATDIIEFIKGIDKNLIKDSLYIYVGNNVSISACGINLCLNKNSIEVEYNSEKVLIIEKKHSKKFLNVFLFMIMIVCVLLYSVIYVVNGYNTGLKTEAQPECRKQDDKSITTTVNDAVINNNEDKTLISADDTIVVIVPKGEIAIENNELKSAVIADSILIIEESKNNNVITSSNVNQYKSDSCHAVLKQEKKETERYRKREALKAEAEKYVRIADQAYNDYADSFNESKGIVALTNYKRALDLAKEHDLFFKSEIEKIKQSINALEKELK